MRAEDFDHLHRLEDTFWWFVGMRDVQAALFDDPVAAAAGSLRAPAERVVVDLGCGTGANITWLGRYTEPGATVAGLDVVEQALRSCASRGQRELVLASATHLPFASGSCDVATSFDVLVQIPGDGADEQALEEMHRILRPGGVAFVRCAAYEWMRSGHDDALGTQRRYTLGLLRARAELAGFEVLRATYANTALFPVAAVRRLLLKRLRLADGGSDVKPMPRGLRWTNAALAGVLRLEARWLRRPGRRLPFGLSTIVVLRKPEAV